jgi:hypothetical protein
MLNTLSEIPGEIGRRFAVLPASLDAITEYLPAYADPSLCAGFVTVATANGVAENDIARVSGYKLRDMLGFPIVEGEE